MSSKNNEDESRLDYPILDPLTTREFWIVYLGAGTELSGYPSLNEEFLKASEDFKCEVIIPFSDRFALQFDVDGDHRLKLLDHTNSHSMELGWMDGHQMSDSFRYEEFLKVCRASDLQPPWRAKVLLSQYVTPLPNTVELLIADLNNGLAESKLFSASEAEAFSGYLRRIVREHFQWTEDPELGWLGTIVERDKYPWLFPYTLRTRENAEFDFRLFNEFLNYCSIYGQ